MGQQCELKAASGASLVEASGGATLLEDSGREAFQTAQRAAKSVWEVADQLYAAVESENLRDAKRRIQRAIASARQNADKLPGHEFARKHSTASDVVFLARGIEARKTGSAVEKTA